MLLERSLELTSKEYRLADVIATRTAQRWRSVELDDIKSTLYLWLMENYKTVQRYRIEAAGEAKLFTAMLREANKFSAAEQQVKIGRGLRDDNEYNVEIVSRILPFIFHDWPQSVVKENPVTNQTYATNNPEKYGLVVVMLLDVKTQFERLSKKAQDIIRMRYELQLTLREMSDLLDVSEMAVKKRLDRALKYLVDSLAGKSN